MNVISADLEIVVDNAIYTESPRWHNGAFWFSDIGAGQVCRVSSAGEKEVVLSDIPTPSGLGWTQSGDLLIASIHTSTIFRVGADNVPKILFGPEQHGTFGTNDMATAGSRSYVTCAGRVYQDGDSFETLAQPVGKILLLDHEAGTCQTVASGLKMPNGVAISPDGRTLIVAELFAQRILKFDIQADGSLSESRVFAQLDTMVDGLCLDAEGGVWAGATATNKFQRIDPQGKFAEVVDVPGWGCIACMLGGADGRDLYMAVSQMETPDAIFNGQAKGRILKARVAIPAAPEATFA
jgi:sugar lactone lactonase YvrE